MQMYWYYNKFLLSSMVYCLLPALFACQTAHQQSKIDRPSINQTSKAQATHKDSTHYFLDKTASISLRASLNNGTAASMQVAEGYKFQFRTIQQSISITGVSIVSGGRLLTFTDDDFLLNSQQAKTLQLSVEVTRFIQKQVDTVLRFKANGASLLFKIHNHQLQPLEFAPHKTPS